MNLTDMLGLVRLGCLLVLLGCLSVLSVTQIELYSVQSHIDANRADKYACRVSGDPDSPTCDEYRAKHRLYERWLIEQMNSRQTGRAP